MTNPYGYQYEKLSTAVSLLMSLDIDAVPRIEGAMQEFHIAFNHVTPGDDCFDAYDQVRQIWGHQSIPDRARSLSEDERYR